MHVLAKYIKIFHICRFLIIQYLRSLIKFGIFFELIDTTNNDLKRDHKHQIFYLEVAMKKQSSYTITLGFSSSDQKLLTQVQRESNGAHHSLESVVYRLAADGIGAALKTLHEANIAK